MVRRILFIELNGLGLQLAGVPVVLKFLKFQSCPEVVLILKLS